ncbi:alpha/beta hydrolase [Kitasatospora camelliae]|uniref:Alpha/beta hydrolase n=1 Tax=Kitasatospora camelliae TaxID=3156397 RepID=A0AAU8JX06_9ACTN
MDHAALLAARPAALAEAAEAYQRLVDAVEARHDDWARDTVARLDASGWQGRAADLAGAAVHRAGGRLQAAWMELVLVRDVLREAAEAFGLVQSRGRDHPVDGTDTDGTSLARVLAEAEHADRATADRLARLAASARDPDALRVGHAALGAYRLADPTDGLGSLLDGTLPPPDSPPERLAAWWAGLGPDARDALVLSRPELIGRLDGLPARDRDRANRILLDRLLAHPDRLSPRVGEGLLAIRGRLAAEGPDVLLLALDSAGQGRAVLSFGDPDRADDVAVYVPGFGTELACVGHGDGDRAQRVRAAAERQGGGRTAAGLVWLGYDAPPNEGLRPGSVHVAGDARAREGAVSYRRFLDGLRAARPPGAAPAHVTALGHSYGSLVVGTAAARPGGPLADEVVLVGSPGVGSDRAEQLGVGAEHVYVGAAGCDPVGRVPARGEAAGGLLAAGPVGVAARVLAPDDLWFGRDPAGDAFGARRFQVAPGEPSHAFDSHSAYFDEGSESLANIARVVSGHPDAVTRPG